MSKNPIMDMLVQGSGGGGGGGGKSGGGSSGMVAVEAPNTLQSKAILKVIEVISEGEIVGLVNGAQSIFFNDTPLQNADNSYNFQGLESDGKTQAVGVTYDTRTGTPSQAFMPGFPDVEDEIAVGVKVFNGGPVVRTITDHDLDAVRVTIQVPALTDQDPTTGNLNGSSVAYKISLQPNGGSYTDVINTTLTGKTTAVYQRAYRIPLTGSPPWNLKVTRVTADNVKVNIENDLYWTSYTQIQDIRMIYPDTAYIGMSIDSQLFGSSVPVRSYHVKGVKINIPTNYNPVTRIYTGVWDGTFTKAWTNNPAWVLYDLLVNNRYGLGQYLSAAEIDKYSLYTIGQYCDGLVPDGFGGTEPRFTFNYSIENQDTAIKVLQAIASSFRGMMYWGASSSSGVITAVADQPKDPVKLFTNANVIAGLFTYSGTALESRHSAVWVTWNNPQLKYKADVEVYEDPKLIALYGYVKIDVVAYGCTSRGQAKRFGKWILETEQNEPETCVFSVGLADADTRPGDIVKVADKDYMLVRYGGRIISATSTSATLDSPVTLDALQTWSIDIVLPDGTFVTKTLTDTPGTYTTVHWTGALSTVPNQYAVFAITASDVSPRQFRVIAIKESTPTEFELTTMVYDSTKFDRVEQNINLTTPSFTRLDTGPIGMPVGPISILPYLSINGITLIAYIHVAWSASPDSRVQTYKLEAIRPGGATGANGWELIKQDAGLSCEVSTVPDGVWSFKVTALDALGNPSQPLYLNNQTITINVTTPPDVTGFSLAPIGNTGILTWNHLTAVNIDHFELRYSHLTTGTTWANSLLVTAQISPATTSTSVPLAVGTYLIKAVTVPTSIYPQGIYSNNPTDVICTVDPLFNYKLVSTITEDNTFTGTKTNVQVNAGSLELSTISSNNYYPTGEYDFANTLDLGAIYVARVNPVLTASGNSSTNNVDLWTNVDTITNVDGSTDGQWGLSFQISTSKDNVTYTDWANCAIGDYNFRYAKFRVLFNSYFASTTPSIVNLGVKTSMPGLIQSATATTTAAAYTVTYPQVFNGTPDPGIIANNMATGDYYTVSGASANGFTIEFFNAAGAAQIRTFSYISKGYGYVTT